MPLVACLAHYGNWIQKPGVSPIQQAHIESNQSCLSACWTRPCVRQKLCTWNCLPRFGGQTFMCSSGMHPRLVDAGAAGRTAAARLERQARWRMIDRSCPKTGVSFVRGPGKMAVFLGFPLNTIPKKGYTQKIHSTAASQTNLKQRLAAWQTRGTRRQTISNAP